MKYIKKAIPVTAIQWNGPEDNEKVLPAKITEGANLWLIHTLEGTLHLIPGCWIVGPGYKGEYWPVDEEIFAQTYEEYSATGFKTEVAANALTLAIAAFFVDRNQEKLYDQDCDKLNSIIRKFLEKFTSRSN
jgi:hypothetical protein